MLSWFRSDFVSVSNTGLFYLEMRLIEFLCQFFCVPDLCHKLNAEASLLNDL
jgi:hypothetical protein